MSFRPLADSNCVLRALFGPVCRQFLPCVLALIVLCTARVAGSEWNFSGGVTSTYQVTSDNRVDPEVVASADFVLQRMFKRGDLRLYIEANSTPRAQGVSALLPEVNTDAGSALNRQGDGRIQVSELAYHHMFGNQHEFTLGLVDVSGYFDRSRIASDENTQFLAASFVQNPAIDLPDYTLGAVYEHTTGRDLILRIGLTSSNGLADNPNLSYAQLLDVDENDKGVFAITSAAFNKLNWQMRAGTWAILHLIPVSMANAIISRIMVCTPMAATKRVSGQ